jgi:dihydroorotate dehydrogenase
MGFNNRGSAALASRLRTLREQGRWPAIPVGANVGKSKVTPLDEAPSDYATSVRRLGGLVDYFAVNVSSPNTPGLRELQERAHLERVLGAVMEAADGTPVLLKLAPDLAQDALREAVSLAAEVGVRGIIATNTTVDRPGLTRDPEEIGGLSGAPLWPLARRCITTVIEEAAGRLSVVGVGGIDDPEQVRALLDAGCAAVQVYTGLIYRGPGLPDRINRAL